MNFQIQLALQPQKMINFVCGKTIEFEIYSLIQSIIIDPLKNLRKYNHFQIHSILAKLNRIKTVCGLITVLVLVAAGCSTKKNTGATRFYHAFTTRYNIRFNGVESYKDGLKSIQKANQDNYSEILPMYPVSVHKNTQAATSNMDRTIEKCRKAIKLHSIKKKPDKNYKKASDPDYMKFYNQEEFNPALRSVWLLLAQSEFHKGEFLSSIGTFTYITHHYAYDKDMVAQCTLWMARAYGELGWMYEAEQMLSKVNQDDLERKNSGLFASVNADVLLKKRSYAEAIPYLKVAYANEPDKKLRQRFAYILAQLSQNQGDNKAAYEYFTHVIKSSPSYEMDFNARIARAQLDQGNIASLRKDLLRMAKNPKNKEYLDQIYYALGNTYLQRGDTAKAIENYHLSIQKSTRNRIDKAITYIKLGDLYYGMKKYIDAEPNYSGAAKIITKENTDYLRVSQRAEVLGDLAKEYNTVVLQDSLQKLAALPEKERLDVIDKLIAKVVADEKAKEKQAEIDQLNILNNNTQQQMQGGVDDFESKPTLGNNNMNNNAGNWYFYNPSIIKSGQADFLKSWGRRNLEDNWRVANKTSPVFTEDVKENSVQQNPDSAVGKGEAAGVANNETDNKKPGYYLKQLPFTKSQLDKSNTDIADALYKMGFIYKDKLEEYGLAEQTFNEFIKRFGGDKRLADVYYSLYQIGEKTGDNQTKETNREKLVADYPDTKYAKILSQPDYFDKLRNMKSEQDSLYAETYQAYLKNDFNTVFKNTAYTKQHYPLSSLMPKFMFLNALSIGKTQDQAGFEKALGDLVTNYPESDVSSMSKDMLALTKQGKQAQNGSTFGSLLSKRNDETATAQKEMVKAATQKFTADKTDKQRVLFLCSTDDKSVNKLMYQLAGFNFTRFMIKDFDLNLVRFDSINKAITVGGLDSYDEAVWYNNTLNSDETMKSLLADMQVKRVIVSETDLPMINSSESLSSYLTFIGNQKLNDQTVAKVDNKPSVDKSPTKDMGSSKTGVVATTLTKEQKPAKTEKTTNPAKGTNDQASLVTKTEQKPGAQKPAAEQKKETIPDNQPEVAIQQPKSKPEVTDKKSETASAQKPATETSKPAAVEAKPKVEEPPVPLYKGLFGYRANEPHFIALYVLSGDVDFNKVKSDFDAFNAKNYSMLNLTVSLESYDKQKVIIVGSFNDANIAKSYLLRIVKENSLFGGLKNTSYRNLIGSQKNLNVMIQNNALNTYFDFMREYYLK